MFSIIVYCPSAICDDDDGDDDDDDDGDDDDDDDERSPIFLGGFSWLLSPFSPKDLLVQDGLECTLVLPRLAALSTQLVRTDAAWTSKRTLQRRTPVDLKWVWINTY